MRFFLMFHWVILFLVFWFPSTPPTCSLHWWSIHSLQSFGACAWIMETVDEKFQSDAVKDCELSLSVNNHNQIAIVIDLCIKDVLLLLLFFFFKCSLRWHSGILSSLVGTGWPFTNHPEIVNEYNYLKNESSCIS